MHPLRCWPLVLLFAGCAAAPTVGRVPPVAPLPIDVPQADLVRDTRRLADADRRVSAPVVDEVVAADPPDAQVTYRTFTRIVEVPVEVESSVAGSPEAYASGPDPYVRVYDYDRPYRRDRRWFPVHTVVGAGIGAAIGRHHGHTRRGAWIGAHTGLLFDLARWWR